MKNKLVLLVLALLISVSGVTSRTESEKGLETRKLLRADEGNKGFESALKNKHGNLRSMSDDDDSSDDEGPFYRFLCWFTKKKKLPRLKLKIKIINDDGGASDKSQWIMHADAKHADAPQRRNFQCIPDSKNKFHRVEANVPYQLGCEHSAITGAIEYKELGWSCSDGGKMIDDTTVKLKWGEKVVCTATVDDEFVIPPDPCDNVECPEGTACDPLTGKCLPIEEVVPCVGIIDEWTYPDDTVDEWWENFRAEYPTRPYCLLTPVPQGQTRHIPSNFTSDPRTIQKAVNRDDKYPDTGPSEWFTLCELDEYTKSSTVDFVGVFLDTSGSMTAATVQASLDLFKTDVANAGLTISAVCNGAENWIEPFMTDLKPGGSGGTCELP